MDVMHRESGNALIMALITLLVLTLLGTSSLDNAIIEQRIVRGSVDSGLAFQNAESGLRSIENRLLGYTVLSELESDMKSKNIYSDNENSGYLKKSFWVGRPVLFRGRVVTGPELNALNQSGRGLNMVFIEYLQEMNDSQELREGNTASIYYFRVTSVGTDGAYTMENINAGDTPKRLMMVQSVISLFLF